MFSLKIIGLFNPFSQNDDFFTLLQNMPFENSVGEGENAGKQQFLLFQQCFVRTFRRFVAMALH